MIPVPDTLLEALRQVMDPEAGMNIVDLGLVYRLEILHERVQADLTMTSPACPLSEGILSDARAVLQAAVPEAWQVEVSLVWDPPWGPERMSERARLHFGWA